MTISIPAKPISIVKDEFVGSKGETVSYYKSIFIIDGEIVEINTKDERIKERIEQSLNKEALYKFSLEKNEHGTYKFKVRS